MLINGKNKSIAAVNTATLRRKFAKVGAWLLTTPDRTVRSYKSLI